MTLKLSHWARCRTVALAVLAAVLALTSAGAEQRFVRLVLDTSFVRGTFAAFLTRHVANGYW